MLRTRQAGHDPKRRLVHRLPVQPFHPRRKDRRNAGGLRPARPRDLPRTDNLDSGRLAYYKREQRSVRASDKPNLPETVSEESSDGYWFDDFDGQTPENGENALSGMRPDWITPRTPEPGSFALNGGKLKIKGSKYPLSSTDAKGMVVRRQENFDFDVTVKIPAPKFTDGSQNAGITGYYDENTYLPTAYIRPKTAIL